MPSGNGWSLIAFQAAAARNGLTAIVPCTDLTQYTVVGTNYAKLAYKGFVSGFCFKTAAIANWVNGQWRDTRDRNYHRTSQVKDQAGNPSQFKPVVQAFDPNAEFEAQADNGNNSQVEGLYLAVGAQPFKISIDSNELREMVKPGAKLLYVDGAGATAAVANTWTASTTTWSATWNPDRTYRIVGNLEYSLSFDCDEATTQTEMYADSATMYACRLVFSNMDWRPGVPGGDTAGLGDYYYGEFGTFPGTNPPSIENLCSGTDAAQNVSIIVEEL
jgi:hypothetical protein